MNMIMYGVLEIRQKIKMNLLSLLIQALLPPMTSFKGDSWLRICVHGEGTGLLNSSVFVRFGRF